MVIPIQIHRSACGPSMATKTDSSRIGQKPCGFLRTAQEILLNICMQNPVPQLSITDLAVIKTAIDLACSRGAYQAAEMKTLGEVYEKLTTFLDTVIKQAEAEMQGQKGEAT